MGAPFIKMACVSNLWTRQMHFQNVGDVMQGHAHNYDHTTLVAFGRVQFTVDGVTSEFSAPHMVVVAKGKVHDLTALEPNTVCYCVHALRNNTDGEIIDPDMVPAGVAAPWADPSTGVDFL